MKQRTSERKHTRAGTFHIKQMIGTVLEWMNIPFRMLSLHICPGESWWKCLQCATLTTYLKMPWDPCGLGADWCRWSRGASGPFWSSCSFSKALSTSFGMGLFQHPCPTSLEANCFEFDESCVLLPLFCPPYHQHWHIYLQQQIWSKKSSCPSLRDGEFSTTHLPVALLLPVLSVQVAFLPFIRGHKTFALW